MTYRPHLDGIRAVAVMAVVLYHAHVPGVSGGFVGVDVFFVISGYLITGLLLSELEATGDISLVGFIERRVRRLAPALFAVLLATLVAGMVWLSPIGGEQQGLAKSAIAAVFLSANIYFWRHTGGYFDAPTDSFPLLHTWTLSVEEQFYLLWPWLLLAAGWWARRCGLLPARVVLALLFAIFAASLVACIWFTRSHPQAAFFLMPFRAWEFAAGGAAVLLLRWRRMPGRVSELIAVLGLLAVAASIAGLSHDMAFPGWLALIPVLGATALIYGSEANPQGPTATLLALRPMVFLGLISYSLYLWHWPMLSIARVASMNGVNLTQSLFLCAIAVVAAWLTFRYIEQPIRRKRVALMATLPQTFRAGASMMTSLTVIALGLGVWSKSIWPMLPGNSDRVAGLAAVEKPNWDCRDIMPARAVNGAGRGCETALRRPARILIWGDSHAGHLKPVADALETKGVPVILRYMHACPPAFGFSPGRITPEERRACSAFNSEVIADIRSRKDLDTVILSARWVRYAQQPGGIPALTDSLKRTIVAIRAEGLRVVLVGSSPEFIWSVPECLVRRDEGACNEDFDHARALLLAPISVVESITLAFPDLVLIDPFEYLCPLRECIVRNGRSIYYLDQHHLSTAGARQLIPAFLALQMAASRHDAHASTSAAANSRMSIESPSD